MKAPEKARLYFDQGMNCSQAALTAFANELGMDEQTAIQVASAFGGGIARTGAACGAATGALMALGLKYGANSNTDPAVKEKLYTIGQDFLQRFTAQNGAVNCKDLLGYDLSTPEGRQQARDQGLFRTHCPIFVQSAAEIAEEMIERPLKA